MSNRLLPSICVLASAVLWAGSCDACCTPPYVVIDPCEFWVIPGYPIDLEADELNGVCLTSWQWYVAYGGHKSKVDEYDGCWGGNGYSVYRLWFDYVDVYNPYVYANSACSSDGDDAVFTVVEMGFSPSSPYPYIAVNDDDDDENGRMDNHNQDPDGPLVNGLADDDLVPLLISVDSPVAFPDEVTLGLIHDTSGLQVWEDPNRAGPVITGYPDVEQTWPAGSWSQTVHVEGMHASSGYSSSDPKLTWYYFGGSGRDNLTGWNGEPASEKRWTVVHVDMDMTVGTQDVKDDDYTWPGITEEIKPGAFIPLDGSAELILKPVQPALTSPPYWSQVTLSVQFSGTGRVRIRDPSTMEIVTLPTTYSLTEPKTLLVEAYQVSSNPCDITLVLNHVDTGFKDRINITVSGINSVDFET